MWKFAVFLIITTFSPSKTPSNLISLHQKLICMNGSENSRKTVCIENFTVDFVAWSWTFSLTCCVLPYTTSWKPPPAAWVSFIVSLDTPRWLARNWISWTQEKKIDRDLTQVSFVGFLRLDTMQIEALLRTYKRQEKNKLKTVKTQHIQSSTTSRSWTTYSIVSSRKSSVPPREVACEHVELARTWSINSTLS